MATSRASVLTRIASASALVGLVVLLALSLTRRAEATDGDPIVAGNYNTQTVNTFLYDNTLFPAAQGCDRLDAHDGFVACGEDGLIGRGIINGVTGFSSNSTASGVYGENDGAGFGVAGRAVNGTGVLADSSNGTALAVSGRATFTRSGKVNIAYPNKTAVVSVPGGLAASALALAMVQDTTGVYVKSAVPNTSNGTIQINLNKAPGTGTNPKTAHVAWFVVN